MEQIIQMENESLDIISLIEKNPITRLSSTYNNKLLEKVKSQFNDTQQQLFLSSFYCYLNHNPDKDFIIDLDNVWKWCGFSRKDKGTRLLKNIFKQNEDYKILLYVTEQLPRTGEQDAPHGGCNKEQILMTIKTFKKFCMKARTDKADEIHDYYIKLEELLHETLKEESEELRLKLLSKETLIKSQEKELNKLKKVKNCIYIGHTNVYNNMTKIGITEDLARRLESHKSSNPHFEYLFTYKSENAIVIENHIKLLLKNWKSNKSEWFSVSTEHLKILVEHYIDLYDNHKFNESVGNIIKFISNLNYKKLRM